MIKVRAVVIRRIKNVKFKEFDSAIYLCIVNYYGTEVMYVCGVTFILIPFVYPFAHIRAGKVEMSTQMREKAKMMFNT